MEITVRVVVAKDVIERFVQLSVRPERNAYWRVGPQRSDKRAADQQFSRHYVLSAGGSRKVVHFRRKVLAGRPRGANWQCTDRSWNKQPAVTRAFGRIVAKGALRNDAHVACWQRDQPHLVGALHASPMRVARH